MQTDRAAHAASGDPAPGGKQAAEGSDDTLDTRERLVRAAIEVFLEKGYGGSRVQDIARKAGYTAGALYVHFPSRTALLGEAIMLEGRQIIGAIVEKLTAMKPGEGRVARSFTELVVAESSPIDVLMLEALALASREDEAREMLASTLQDLEQSMVTQIEAARDLGFIDPELDVVAIKTFLAAWILGMIVHRAIGLPVPAFDDTLDVYTRLVGGLAPA
jgi:AcrR family transcriptional regulator